MFLEISQNSQKNNYASLYFNNVAGLRTSTLLKKRFWHWCFPVNFAKLLRTPFLQNNSGRLLRIVFSNRCLWCLEWQMKENLNEEIWNIKKQRLYILHSRHLLESPFVKRITRIKFLLKFAWCLYRFYEGLDPKKSGGGGGGRGQFDPLWFLTPALPPSYGFLKLYFLERG